jgi:hypothetical protein
MAEFIGPIEEKSGKRSLDDIVASIVGKREDRPDSGIAGLRAGPRAAMRSRGDSFETKALKNTLAAVSLFDEKDQEAFFSVFDGMVKTNIINPDESLAKIKASELAAKQLGYDGAIPVDLDEKTLFKIMLDTQDKLPADLRLKLEGNTDIVGNKELEKVSLTAGKLGINFDGETAVGNYNYRNGKLRIKPIISRTDDTIKTDTTAQYLFNEDMIMIMGPNNEPRYVPKESITVKFNTDKMIDNNSGSVSYVLRTDEGAKKGTVLLSSDADKFETGASYITDKGIKVSGEFEKDYLTKDEESKLGINFPITSFADIEASKKFGDKDDENNLRLNVDKTFELDHGGGLNVGGYYDQNGVWHAGINYSLAFGEGDDRKYKKHRSPINYDTSLMPGLVWQDGELVERSELEQLKDKQDYENWMYGQTYGFNEPSEALEFAKEKKILPEIKFAGGGRVRMASGGIVGILKL